MAIDTGFWTFILRETIGDQTSSIEFYTGGEAAQTPGAFSNAIQVAFNATEPETPERDLLIDRLFAEGVIEGNPDLWKQGTEESIGPVDFQNLGDSAETVLSGATPDTTDTAPGDTVGGAPIPGIPIPQRVGTETVGDAVIPTGMRLVRITDPSGTDAGELFVLVGDVFGVNLAFEIGDRAAVDEHFGGISRFSSLETFTQAQFDASDTLTVGTIDEILGTAESLQAQFERDMRSAGFESLPTWLAADQKALTTYITGVNEGWSAERINVALSGTDAFKVRFLGIDVVMNQLGTTSLTEGIAAFTGREDQIRQSILASRGPRADVSQPTVTSLIASGWQPAEIEELLGLEKRVKDNLNAMDNINQILVFQGQNPLSPDNLGFATELGTGVSEGIASPEQFTRQAQLAAGFIASNQAELNFEKLGLTREDIIAASFGEVPENGRPVSEVNQILEQFARERSRAASGFSGGQSFIDASGRLRTQGFADLT